jgi:hypothetical protein
MPLSTSTRLAALLEHRHCTLSAEIMGGGEPCRAGADLGDSRRCTPDRRRLVIDELAAKIALEGRIYIG